MRHVLDKTCIVCDMYRYIPQASKFWGVQGAKKIIFTACHSGKLKLAFTSPDVISTSPKSFSSSRIDFTLLLLFEFLKEHHLPLGQVKTDFTSPIAKSTSPGLSDTTFFARWALKKKTQCSLCIVKLNKHVRVLENVS